MHWAKYFDFNRGRFQLGIVFAVAGLMLMTCRLPNDRAQNLVADLADQDIVAITLGDEYFTEDPVLIGAITHELRHATSRLNLRQPASNMANEICVFTKFDRRTCVVETGPNSYADNISDAMNKILPKMERVGPGIGPTLITTDAWRNEKRFN